MRPSPRNRPRLPGIVAICSLLGTTLTFAAGQPEPLWAYGFLTPPAPGDTAVPQPPPTRSLRKDESPLEQTRLRHVEGSKAAYSEVDIRDGANVIDWFPGDHPPFTSIMAHGPAALGSAARGCAQCHLPNGHGRPENAPTAGQSESYILQQLRDFRSGARHSADSRKPNTPTMTAQAGAMTDAEMKVAAEYFAGIKWTPWIRVVETDFVPKTKIEGNLFLPIEQARTEPIAGRIIEVPQDEEQSETLRNPHSGFLAYVPVGSLKKGENLVTTGGMSVVNKKIVNGHTVTCSACHGPDLMGLADVPGIAGRSPSNLARQLYDFQQGTRKGVMAVQMQPTVANLTGDDIVAIVAYVASLPVPAKPAH